jgi:DNA-binding NtrC family response regulator
MQEIYEQIDRMSHSSPNVLIQGESGTGKELTAHVIHKNSDRKQKAFVPVNCKSFGKGIAANQIYDHALKLFKSSVGGTIFFNEIAEIAPDMQAEISRAYSENILPSGAVDEKAETSVRLLAATNRNLEEAGGREIVNRDFLNCTNDVIIQLPPLRERKEDICLLINHFLAKFNTKRESTVLNVSLETLDLLLRYNWPGNVIQLENVIERAFALKVDLNIEVDDLPSEIKTFGEISKIS